MLSKSHRLSRKDFELVFKKGRRLRSNNFNLILLLQEDPKQPIQFGVAVSKKAYRKAVDRNKIKRQIRSAVRQKILAGLEKSYKIVIMAFPVPKPLKYKEIEDELIELFEKLKQKSKEF